MDYFEPIPNGRKYYPALSDPLTFPPPPIMVDIAMEKFFAKKDTKPRSVEIPTLAA